MTDDRGPMTGDRRGATRGEICREAGVYCLVLRVRRASRIWLSRFGSCRIEPGWYVYTGSAKRHLLPRLTRHLRRHKRLHWHIDSLRAVASLPEIWVWPWTSGGECRTNTAVALLPGATLPWKGFGSSDCRCHAHLVFFPSRPEPPDLGVPFRYQVRGARLTRIGW